MDTAAGGREVGEPAGSVAGAETGAAASGGVTPVADAVSARADGMTLGADVMTDGVTGGTAGSDADGTAGHAVSGTAGHAQSALPDGTPGGATSGTADGTTVDAVTGAASGAPSGVDLDVRTLPLGSASGTVPLARDFTRSALYDWGWLPAATAEARAAAEDVLLVVSELVTNACLHADGAEELRVRRRAKVLRLEVDDRGAGQPAPRTPHRAGRPGGHGMFIVQRLCLDWGIERTPGAPGKTVWAELAAPA